jgi:GTP-binding protein
MPNAGKSTMLRAISAARPKVADYPFTTLDPQLGIAELPGERRIVFADIPGLIEGAQAGAGLGHAFLRHIERTKIIVHMVDLFPLDGSDPVENYRVIRRELEAFSPELGAKVEIIGANKIDLALEEEVEEAVARLREALPGREIIPVSGASHQGVRDLLERAWVILHPPKE